MYADGLVLISVSLHDIQRMIEICASVLRCLDLMFNVRKCGLLRVGPCYNRLLNSLIISQRLSVKLITYLGITLCAGKVL